MKYSSIKKRLLALGLAVVLAIPSTMVAHATGVNETPEVTEEVVEAVDENAQVIESEEGLASVSGRQAQCHRLRRHPEACLCLR